MHMYRPFLTPCKSSLRQQRREQFVSYEILYFSENFSKLSMKFLLPNFT